MIREIHGIADAATCRSDGTLMDEPVTICDGKENDVLLKVDSSHYMAVMTPDQADFIAKELIASAERCRNAEKEQA